MRNVLKNGKIVMYADDTTLYVSGRTLSEVQMKLQSEFDTICLWIKRNKLSLNIDKTKFMIIGSKQRLTNVNNNDNILIKHEGKAIDQVRTFKCLGVTIDENLLWTDHVNNLCRKVYAGLAMLKRVKPYVDVISLKLLYNCLIQSQIDYCSEVWGNRFSSHTDKITKLQKRAARMILNCNIHTPSKEIFQRMKWLPFNERVKYFKCVYVFKCVNNLSSDYYNDVFKEVSSMHDFNTRQCANHHLILNKCRTEYFMSAICYDGAKQWNFLPLDIKQSASLQNFKLKLKNYLFNLAAKSS